MSEEDYIVLADIIPCWAEETGDEPLQLAALLAGMLREKLAAVQCRQRCIPKGNCDCSLSLPPQSGKPFADRAYKEVPYKEREMDALCEKFVWRRETGFPDTKAHKPITMHALLSYFAGSSGIALSLYSDFGKPEKVCVNKRWLRQLFQSNHARSIPAFLAASSTNEPKRGRKSEHLRKQKLQEEAEHVASVFEKKERRRPTKTRVAELIAESKKFAMSKDTIERNLRVTW